MTARLTTVREHIAITYRYHMTPGAMKADPKWAKRWLQQNVKNGTLTQEQADAIRGDTGEALQGTLF